MDRLGITGWICSIVLLGMTAPPVYGLHYLEVERMVREGMSVELIKAQIDRDLSQYTFEEIIYLQERKLPNELVDYFLRYHLISMPDIDVELLIQMKSLKWSDDTIDMLVNRFGVTSLPLTGDEIIQLKKAQLDDKLIETLIREGE